METTSRVGAQDAPDTVEAVPAARLMVVDGYLKAPFPWYALDEAFTGPRRLMPLGTAADGEVQHGSIGHGDEPVVRGDSAADKQRFAVVVTVASSPVRRSGDGTGVLEATTVSSAA